MFEAISINHTYRSKIDIGLFLESLLFYKKVHLIIDERALNSITSNIPLLSFIIELHKTNNIECYLISAKCGVSKVVDEIWIFNDDHKDKSPLILNFLLQKASNIFEYNLIIEFWDLVRHKNHLQDLMPVHEDIFDDYLFRASINSVLELHFPDLNDYSKLYVLGDRIYTDKEKGIFKYDLIFDDSITSRIDSEFLTMLETNPLSAVIDTNFNIDIALTFKSDLQIKPMYDTLYRNKIFNLLNRNIPNLYSKADLFQTIEFNDFKSVSFAINSGQKSLEDFRKLFEKSEKFRTWLHNIPIEKNALTEYFKNINSDEWYDKIPVKSTRWSIFTGIGLVVDALGAGGLGTLSGIGISAIDEFFLDSILKGWKPNQFITGDLKTFLS